MKDFHPSECHIKVGCTAAALETVQTGALLMGVCEDEKTSLQTKSRAAAALIDSLKKRNGFKGKRKELLVINRPKGLRAEWVVVAGLGKRKELTAEKMRKAASEAVKAAGRLGVKDIALEMTADGGKTSAGAAAVAFSIEERTGAVLESVLLTLYGFEAFKTAAPKEVKKIRQITLIAPAQASLRKMQKTARDTKIIADAVYIARDLANAPANYHTPEAIAQIAKKLSLAYDISCEVYNEDRIKKLGMGGLLSVARGSAEPPRFIILKYDGAKETGPIVLAGKGITFDSGGISLKPGNNMHEMKFDMSGAAAVLAALLAASRLRLPVNLIGLIGAAENLPGPSAVKPGDVTTTYSGKTVEILNTDAEGRMVLADILAFAKKQYKPRFVIDLATLTGACRIALGRHASGIMGTDEALIEKIRKAGEATGERVWPLPLWEEHIEAMKSDVADLKNISQQEGGGTMTAAGFLSTFIEGVPWAHIDIAGTADVRQAADYLAKGATGVGVRLLVHFLKNYSAQ